MTATLGPSVGGTSPGRAEALGPDSVLSGRARQLGLPSATALVVGSIIGTGVFTMPAEEP